MKLGWKWNFGNLIQSGADKWQNGKGNTVEGIERSKLSFVSQENAILKVYISIEIERVGKLNFRQLLLFLKVKN